MDQVLATDKESYDINMANRRDIETHLFGYGTLFPVFTNIILFFHSCLHEGASAVIHGHLRIQRKDGSLIEGKVREQVFHTEYGQPGFIICVFDCFKFISRPPTLVDYGPPVDSSLSSSSSSFCSPSAFPSSSPLSSSSSPYGLDRDCTAKDQLPPSFFPFLPPTPTPQEDEGNHNTSTLFGPAWLHCNAINELI